MTTSIVGAIILIAVGILLIFAADRLPSPWRYLVYGVVIVIGLVWLLQATGLLAQTTNPLLGGFKERWALVMLNGLVNGVRDFIGRFL
jgi:hypothetical protein